MTNLTQKGVALYTYFKTAYNWDNSVTSSTGIPGIACDLCVENVILVSFLPRNI